jgi:N-acetylneuraminic acid mutarotase
LNHVNLAAYGGRLYALGGLNQSFGAVGSAWSYDPAADAWTPIASMPAGTERGAAAVGVVSGRIVLAGGYRLGSVRDVSAYDPATDTWTALPPLPVARDHLVGAVYGDTLLAIGGRTNGIIDGRVDALAADAGVWGSRTPMKTPRAGCAAAMFADGVLVAGGEGNGAQANGIFPQVEVYDFATDSWRSVDSEPTFCP